MASKKPLVPDATSDTQGFRSGLTNYGDAGFSLFSAQGIHQRRWLHR